MGNSASALLGNFTSALTDMADFARNNEEFLRRFMRLEHGPPSHDSFSRLLRMLDPVPFAAALARFAADWAKALEAEGVRQIAIDGKALRRTFSKASELSPLHLVNAFSPESGVVLGQVAVDGKSNEITALPALLEMLDIEGAVVTADAMHTQRDAAELTAGKGGDYVLALKGNQGSLHKDVKDWLEDPGNAKKMLSHQQASRGHGREETRTAMVCHDIGPLRGPPVAGPRGDRKGRVGPRLGGADPHRDALLPPEPEDVSRGLPEGGPEPLGDQEPAALGSGRLDAGGRPSEPDGPRPGESRGGPPPDREHGAPDDDKLSIRRRLLRAAQVPKYRLEIIANAAKLAEKL